MLKRIDRLHFLFLLVGLFTLNIALPGQSISIHHPQLRFLFEDSLMEHPAYHSALLPFKTQANHFNNVLSLKSADSVKVKSFYATPVLDASAGYYPSKRDFDYRFGQGGIFAGNLGRKAGYEISAVLYEQKFPNENYSIDSLKLVPRNNRFLWGKNEEAVYLSVRGNIFWKANKWLTFTAGNDKHYIGDGQQSLLLSENPASYPFFQTRLKIWKVQYQHQIMFMRDLVYGRGSKRFTKYSSQHSISYNISPRINFYVFEAVIWRKQDSVRHRGFDLTYMNPFLFFRPVEFNQGSPDNVLMGIGGKFRIWKKSYLYGQFLLDEFHLKEVKANRNWWGSKYGYQVGFKTYGLFPDKKSLLSVEYNHMRPFTYSHTYSLQNYGYLMEPLAHPLGSNFREVTGVLRIAITSQWLIHAQGSFMRYGRDPAGLNYGSDMYKGQWTFSKYYGNNVAQGVLHTIIAGELTLSRILFPAWRLSAFANLGLTMHKISDKIEWQPQVQVGLNTLLYE